MRILTIVWSIGVGGTERAAVNFAIGYQEHGHDSRVLVLGEGNERLAELEEAGVGTCFVQSDKRNEAVVFEEFKTWAPHIIHLHNFTKAFIPYLDKIKTADTKVVETNHFSRPNYGEEYKAIALSMQLSGWGYWKYTRWMKGADYTPQVAIVSNIVNEKNFITPSKESINTFLQSHEIPAGAFVAGRLGQAHPSKWDYRIFEVVERTVKPDNNIYYFFVGMPVAMIKELDNKSAFVKSRIKLVASIQGDENLSLYYHSLNCFAHISKIGESFGYVLAEAMMCKVPVVTMLTPFHDNAQFEVVNHDFGGKCVIDTEGFVAAIMQLHNSPEDCERFKQNLADHWIEKRFGAAAVTPKQVEYFTQLIEGKKIATQDVKAIIKNCFAMYGAKKNLMLFFLRLYNSHTTFLLLKRFKKLLK